MSLCHKTMFVCFGVVQRRKRRFWVTVHVQHLLATGVVHAAARDFVLLVDYTSISRV